LCIHFFVRSVGTAVIKRKDPGMLTSAGKSVVLTKDWAHYLLHRMGYVKRKVTTKAKNTVEDFGTVKSDFLLDSFRPITFPMGRMKPIAAKYTTDAFYHYTFILIQS